MVARFIGGQQRERKRGYRERGGLTDHSCTGGGKGGADIDSIQREWKGEKRQKEGGGYVTFLERIGLGFCFEFKRKEWGM